MPEIPNVVPGEPVEADWGNDIRDRSVQKYADLTALEASQPVPQLGEMAWLDNPGWLVVCTDAIAPTWTPLLDQSDGDARWVEVTGDVMTGQLRIQGENIVTEGSTLGLFMIPTPGTNTDDWRVISTSAGLLIQSRNSGAFANVMQMNKAGTIDFARSVRVAADDLTVGAGNARVILARSGQPFNWRLAIGGGGNLLLQSEDVTTPGTWVTRAALNGGGDIVFQNPGGSAVGRFTSDRLQIESGNIISVVGGEITLTGTGTQKIRYTAAGTAIQTDRDAIWVSTGVGSNYRLDTIASLAADDPVVADFFTDVPTAQALVGGHSTEGPTHRDIIQALVHEVTELRARVDALEGP